MPNLRHSFKTSFLLSNMCKTKFVQIGLLKESVLTYTNNPLKMIFSLVINIIINGCFWNGIGYLKTYFLLKIAFEIQLWCDYKTWTSTYFLFLTANLLLIISEIPKLETELKKFYFIHEYYAIFKHYYFMV